MSLPLSTIEFSPSEHNSKIIDIDTIKNASNLYNKNGFLILKNVIDSDVIQKMYDSYLNDNKKYFTDDLSLDAMHVGHRRKMITVEIKGPFNTTNLYANPFILPIISNLLGETIILGSLGSVAALPDSNAQHTHFDHPNLFGDDEIEEILNQIPPFAITVIIPLVNITEENGPTRMWPGSHLEPRRNKQKLIDNCEYFDPIANIGDCILFDYRMLHGGMANTSDSVRPILYAVYYRYWFRDVVNYSKQNPLVVSAEEYKNIPTQYRFLFEWMMEEKQLINNTQETESELSRNRPCDCGSGLKFKRCHGKLT